MREFKINNEQNFVSNESFYMSWQMSFATKPNFTRQNNLLCNLYKTDLKTGKFLNSRPLHVAVFWLINYFTAGIILQYSMAHSKLLLLDTWIVAVGL